MLLGFELRSSRDGSNVGLATEVEMAMNLEQQVELFLEQEEVDGLGLGVVRPLDKFEGLCVDDKLKYFL